MKTYKWTIEIEVGKDIVADGFDLAPSKDAAENDEELTCLIRDNLVPFSYEWEVKCKVLSAPPRKEILKEQGCKGKDIE